MYKRLVHHPNLPEICILECCLHDHQHKIDLHIAVVMPDHVVVALRRTALACQPGAGLGLREARRHRIFFPNAESASSTASDAVRLCSSITGFTSTISKLSIRPWSATISIARCASR